MHYIMGELVIARPVNEVFDVVAEMHQELPYRSGRLNVVTTHTVVERPHLISWTISSSGGTVCDTLRFERAGDGTRLRWCWTVHPKGVRRLVGRVLVRRGERRQQQMWTRLKEDLETAPRQETTPDVVAPTGEPAIRVP
ncbi:MAG: hypothetical protein JWP40_3865 [Blastococcus sp.]|nr:hypothetical protein [Blastococcus sp.]